MDALIVGVCCLVLGIMMGVAGHAGNVDADCKNVGSSYTSNYKLTCEVKK